VYGTAGYYISEKYATGVEIMIFYLKLRYGAVRKFGGGNEH
jgi:hypothetical protein